MIEKPPAAEYNVGRWQESEDTVKKISLKWFIFAVCCLWTVSAPPLITGQSRHDPVKIISWNVQGRGSDPAVIARQMAEFNGVGIWGLCEVEERTRDRLITAAAVGEKHRFRGILSSRGETGRLLIIYSDDVFDLVDSLEYDLIGDKDHGCPMLLAELRHVGSNTRFFFGVNHLFRTIKQKRQEQSRAIRRWVRSRQSPVILVGDYNYDYDFLHDPVTFDRGLNDIRYYDDGLKVHQVLYWLKPVNQAATQSSRKYPRILDFIFINKMASRWEWQSAIIIKKDDFPDNRRTSDHRPLEGIFRIRRP